MKIPNRLTPLVLIALTVLPFHAAMGMTPKAEAPNDYWISMKTKTALLTSRGVDGMDVQVDVLRGRVTLFGRVDTRAQRVRAEQVARGVSGVTRVRNLLQIAMNPAAEHLVQVSDAELKTRLETVLKAEPSLADSRIEVKAVSGGTVMLSGTATTLSDQLQAIRIVRSTPGVAQVASSIKGPDRASDMELWSHGTTPANPDTLSGSGISDNWITMKTKLRLMANEATPSSEINVDTNNHVVTLFGVVPSQASKEAAGTEARQVGGVREVKNQLEVVSPGRKTRVDFKDDQLGAALNRSYKAHGRMHDVNVEVKNGVVRLTGNVATQMDILDATMMAREVRGVRAVRCDLTLKAT